MAPITFATTVTLELVDDDEDGEEVLAFDFGIDRFIAEHAGFANILQPNATA